ncbi:MAG: 3-deoxy-D-manno-octulosonic acid transferase [Aquabacterium sp.]|nr:MAG: 3-deoxy-D-manno-octulosonic acid transferase [Aquabacterium sp.]
MSWRESLARLAYSEALRAGWPFYLARLWWRGRRESGYRAALGERAGFYGDAASQGWIWVHAVSLGETRAASTLVDALRARIPGMRLLLTHGTATGREAGAALLRGGDRQAWLPFDTPGAVHRFLKHFRPRLGVLMETEVWPNLLHHAAKQGVPVVLANARLSEKSLRRGQKLSLLLEPAARSLHAGLAQTEDDAQRLRSMGTPRVQVCGNLKFDMQPAPELLARGSAWRAAAHRPLVMAAASREGEEAALLRAWREAQAAGGAVAGARLLVVPRHPQRFDEVADEIRRAGYALSRRSAWGEAGPGGDALQADVWLGDSLGEMPAYYAAADLALLGGSFEKLGGQNLIEAAACGCPLLMGPHTFNFADAAELSLQAGAALRVDGLPQAVARAGELLADPRRLQAMAGAARGFGARHRGAAARMADVLAGMLG